MKKILFLLFVLIAAQFFIVSNEAVLGSSVADLEEKIGMAKEENEKLEVKIATFSSYLTISKVALKP